MKTFPSALVIESTKLSSAETWLHLFSVSVNDSTTLRLTPNPAGITFDGVAYQPWGMRIEEVQQETTGGLPTVQVTLSNATREIGAYLEANDVRGRRVTWLTVHSAHLADPAAVVIEERYQIVAARLPRGQHVAVFTLGQDRLESHVFGARFLRDYCRWIYKSPISDDEGGCGYAGSLPSCDKILEGPNGCRAHSNIPRFGGFPLLPGVTGRLT